MMFGVQKELGGGLEATHHCLTKPFISLSGAWNCQWDGSDDQIGDDKPDEKAPQRCEHASGKGSPRSSEIEGHWPPPTVPEMLSFRMVERFCQVK